MCGGVVSRIVVVGGAADKGLWCVQLGLFFRSTLWHVKPPPPP